MEIHSKEREPFSLQAQVSSGFKQIVQGLKKNLNVINEKARRLEGEN